MPITVAVDSEDPTWTTSGVDVVGDDGASEKMQDNNEDGQTVMWEVDFPSAAASSAAPSYFGCEARRW